MPALLDAFVQRIEDHYPLQAPPELLTWLGEYPQLRRDFWLAVDFTYDDIPAALAMLDRLRRHDSVGNAFPKQRGDTPNQAWVEFQALINAL